MLQFLTVLGIFTFHIWPMLLPALQVSITSVQVLPPWFACLILFLSLVLKPWPQLEEQEGQGAQARTQSTGEEGQILYYITNWQLIGKKFNLKLGYGEF